MNVQDAEKEVKRKKEENYITIRIKESYETFLILPFKAGSIVVDALSQAEIYKVSYGKEPTVRELKHEDIVINVISAEERNQAKMRHYLTDGGDSS